jgi:thiamine biosynthesis lipoprotein
LYKKDNAQLIFDHSNSTWVGRFFAMASPCEFIIETTDKKLVQKLFMLARHEVQRIEHKYSRYRNDNIIYQINHSQNQPVTLDAETSRLLDYAQQCYQLSDGMFDITSGVLGKIWNFQQNPTIPSTAEIAQQLQFIGWDKIIRSQNQITLKPGMAIDLGGIGKEYAADKAAQIVMAQTTLPFLINLGGDIHISRPRAGNRPWQIALTDPDSGPEQLPNIGTITLKKGGLTTSGDTHRYILIDGIRYSHILNPKTGWPISDGPRSVTVAAQSCLEAGILSTMALLQGGEARNFLNSQNVPYWIAE